MSVRHCLAGKLHDEVELEGVEVLSLGRTDGTCRILEAWGLEERLNNRVRGQIEHVAAKGKSAGDQPGRALAETVHASCCDVVPADVNPSREDTERLVYRGHHVHVGAPAIDWHWNGLADVLMLRCIIFEIVGIKSEAFCAQLSHKCAQLVKCLSINQVWQDDRIVQEVRWDRIAG
eukprot:CAMPEP_0174702064 /NCGR_PEP_ID=MMETSP1094-20130205/6484_1 /TAXON_ID=156173 /ORGANISM="Chrysochromulina brevifilum, Strain UTEX LB 985" /LENGTH=175 /DNA_ID=CAMNT_0015899791 /DNA_START=446 /DNA_END=973 /DNA_ORIENTATION=-